MTQSHFERTADLMLDYMGSDGDPGWVLYRQFGEWEMLFNLDDDPRLVRKLVRNLEHRGLVEVRRVSAGTQVRMTAAGRKHCADEEARLIAFEAEFGKMLIEVPDQGCPNDSGESVS